MIFSKMPTSICQCCSIVGCGPSKPFQEKEKKDEPQQWYTGYLSSSRKTAAEGVQRRYFPVMCTLM